MIRQGEKAQAVVELAVFGSIILMIFGVLLSYIQQFNSQQYISMEAFRRALERSCTYQGETSGGAGASVQYTLVENRRQSDLSGGYRKGSPVTLSASSNVFWAIPKVGEDPESVLVFKVNEDVKEVKYTDFVPEEHAQYDDDGDKRQKYWSFETENLDAVGNTSFQEQITKGENTSSIINTKDSRLQDTLTTTIPYKIVEKDKDVEEDYDDSDDVILEEGALWELEQGAYLDSDGQYKYKSDKVGTTVERSKTWETAF